LEYSVLNAIGNTPLVKLSKLLGNCYGEVWVKLECLNLGGSVKSRTALGIINAAEKAGVLRKDSIVVEATSGNQGIGLAMISAIKGYQAIIFMPEIMSKERMQLIQAYGGRIIFTPKGKDISETFHLCLDAARKLAEENPKVFIANQFENIANPEIHGRTTAQELIRQLPGPVDAFIAGVGTGGTLTGVGKVLKRIYPHVKVIAVEPEKAAVLSGGPVGHHLQQGIGDGFIPAVLDTGLIDEVVRVKDEDAIETTKKLARMEGLLAGVSGGANVWAAIQVAYLLGKGSRIATLLPDTGERYLSTGLFSEKEEVMEVESCIPT